MTGINGVIEASVVSEEVPLLPSVRFLREVQAVVDLQQGVLSLSKLDVTTYSTFFRSGHFAVIVLELARSAKKCKDPPPVDAVNCGHPPMHLVGARNQGNMEIWCKLCHPRWLLDPTAMSQFMKGAPTVTLGNVIM